ncbi:MAG: RdgB/HAM1 family non-canonical purine NTP pyrophosphatase [Gammaproteobacteria bacterium]|nr:RdgB/HAM1 family non-canonical purine NTP pyrophosphatase [Gammaproteobacteria bacterium]
MNKIVLASSNPGKLLEFQNAFLDTNLDFISQKTLGIMDAEETAHTFLENALLKARHAASISGLPALSDDSGVCVHALHGAPGVYSARYAGTGKSEDNNQKLLQALQNHSNRSAYYCCVLVLIQSETDPNPLVFQGLWQGEILTESRGTSGFGYDPLFYIPALQKSAAELTLTEKNQFSHRAQAIKKLLEFFKETPYHMPYNNSHARMLP